MRKIIIFVSILFFGFSMISCDKALTETTTTAETTTEQSNETCSYNISLDISNGVEQISTYFILTEAHGTNPDNMFWADGISWEISDMIGENDNVQTIDQSDTMNLIKSNDTTISSISIYNFEETLIDTWDSWEEYSSLTTGQYLVVIAISNTQNDCVVTGSCIFIINVN